MAMACVDWRELDRPRLEALYAAEVDRWKRRLGWDTARSWHEVERGRQLGTVQGFVALDARGVAGWTFAVVHHDTLQIGGLAASSELATRALVDSLFSRPQASTLAAIRAFAFTDAPGLSDELSRRGLMVDQYDYLTKALGSEQGADSSDVHRWSASDLGITIDLLAAAYPGRDDRRPFAAAGTADQWREYVAQLVWTSGCGALMAGSSLIAHDADDRPSGVALVTRLADTTAHVAQIVVAPHAQGQGLGRRLVAAACHRAGQAGCDRMTLLVRGQNHRAQQLYQTAGFKAIDRFVSAVRVNRAG